MPLSVMFTLLSMLLLEFSMQYDLYATLIILRDACDLYDSLFVRDLSSPRDTITDSVM